MAKFQCVSVEINHDDETMYVNVEVFPTKQDAFDAMDSHLMYWAREGAAIEVQTDGFDYMVRLKYEAVTEYLTTAPTQKHLWRAFEIFPE